MKRVEVHWLDSSFLDGGWVKKAETPAFTQADLTCITVGYILDRNDTRLLLAGSITDNQTAQLTAIPIKAILKIRRLD